MIKVGLNSNEKRNSPDNDQKNILQKLLYWTVLRLWKEGKIPFTYRGVLAAKWMDVRRAIIERAMRDIQENSCVVFEDITELLKQKISKPDNDHL